MAADPEIASRSLRSLAAKLTARKGRGAYVKARVEDGVSEVTFGRMRKLAVGDEAFIMPMRLTFFCGCRSPFTIAAVRVDRVNEILVVEGFPETAVSTTDVAALLRKVSARITAGVTPLSLTPPTISGAAQSGQTLSATAGTWTNRPTSYAYRWLRCDSTGANCQPIEGATAPMYAVVDADVGSTLAVAVTATNAVATSAATHSAPTAVVTPASLR